jgi:hypothetical protein
MLPAWARGEHYRSIDLEWGSRRPADPVLSWLHPMGHEGAVAALASAMLAGEEDGIIPRTSLWPAWFRAAHGQAQAQAFSLATQRAEEAARALGHVCIVHMVRGATAAYGAALAAGAAPEICVSTQSPWRAHDDAVIMAGSAVLRAWYAYDCWSDIGPDGMRRPNRLSSDSGHDEGHVSPADVRWYAVTIGADAADASWDAAYDLADAMGIPVQVRLDQPRDVIDVVDDATFTGWSDDDLDWAYDVQDQMMAAN